MFKLNIELTIYKVYLYYQQSCLLSYKDNLDIYYLAVWVKEPDIYLVSRVSLIDLLDLETDKDLKTRHLFVKSKYSLLYNIDSKTMKKIYKIPEDYLPLN